MPEIPMVSHAWHTYEGRHLGPNDPFLAKTEEDADDLKLLGFADRKSALPRAAPSYQTTAMQAATPNSAPHTGSQADGEAVRTKRPYIRRDLTAK